MSGGLKRASKPSSLVSDGGGKQASPPLVRSPGFFDLNTNQPDETIESRFFHASDAPKHEPVPKKPEPKKPASFFYADGKKEEKKEKGPSQATSPVLSAVEKRSSGPWIRPESAAQQSKSPPMLSPALSGISSSSPFFAPPAAAQEKPRSPSPSKENIHLSYRKGVSQIFGTRPLSHRAAEPILEHPAMPISRKESVDSTGGVGVTHRKSPSLSSIDSGKSEKSRRRSATTAEIAAAPSPLAQEMKSATVPRLAKQPTPVTSIDTALEQPMASPGVESALSPTKSVSELAADARRERKVLDLEISNSSLLAINSSLEREVRRQKAELKRFRRLSRAGRLSSVPARTARFSEGLSVVGEEGEDDDDENTFGPASGLSELYSDMSEGSEDEESVLSSSEPPQSPSSRQAHRLAKDVRKLQQDMEKHKELLVQSQMMNQSLKRCMYATEDMIREGRKALEYHVRVSDIKLGGRVLSSHEDDDGLDADGDGRPEIEVEDDFFSPPNVVEDEAAVHSAGSEDGMAQAKGLLDVWSSIGRPSYESSEGGDRDSGIEVDRVFASLPLAQRSGNTSDAGRPPGVS